jgi:hypothetical protein
VLVPNLSVLTYVCGLFYLCATPYGAGTKQAQYALNSILYSLVALAALLEFLSRRWLLRQLTSSVGLHTEPLHNLDRESHL